MKRVRILFYYKDQDEPCIKIECWEDEIKNFLSEQDRANYRIEIQYVSK